MRLDAYADGELSDAEVDEMLEHAKNCASCARELETAALLHDAMEHIDDNVAVPLAAQAAWRNAVRREAGAKKLKKRARYLYAAAAAVVVLLGCTAALRGAEHAKVEPMLAAETAQGASAIVVSDGMEPAAKGAVDARRKIVTDDVEAARETVAALCEEYGASLLSEEASDGAVVFRIELPGDYMEDFLNAAAQLGTAADSEIHEDMPETAVLELQLVEE